MHTTLRHKALAQTATHHPHRLEWQLTHTRTVTWACAMGVEHAQGLPMSNVHVASEHRGATSVQRQNT